MGPQKTSYSLKSQFQGMLLVGNRHIDKMNKIEYPNLSMYIHSHWTKMSETQRGKDSIFNKGCWKK